MEDLLRTASIVVGLVVALGAVFVFLRGSLYKGAITALESTVSAQGGRLDSLEKENATLKEKGKSDHARILQLEEDNKTLIQQRPSAEAIEMLSLALSEHDERMIKLFKESPNAS